MSIGNCRTYCKCSNEGAIFLKDTDTLFAFWKNDNKELKFILFCFDRRFTWSSEHSLVSSLQRSYPTSLYKLYIEPCGLAFAYVWMQLVVLAASLMF